MSDANRKAFEIWAEPILGDNPTWKESGDCELAWRAWLAALRARPASQYLCNGTPFKVAVRNGDAMLPYLPDELGGRWVALVAAEDDCHLRAQPDHSEQHLELVSAARAVVERWDTPLWKDAPATAGFINRLRDALPPAIGETME